MLNSGEDNRNKRRDKKFQKKSGMIVHEAGRRLAEILGNIRRKKK